MIGRPISRGLATETFSDTQDTLRNPKYAQKQIVAHCRCLMNLYINRKKEPFYKATALGY